MIKPVAVKEMVKKKSLKGLFLQKGWSGGSSNLSFVCVIKSRLSPAVIVLLLLLKTTEKGLGHRRSLRRRRRHLHAH